MHVINSKVLDKYNIHFLKVANFPNIYIEIMIKIYI